MTPAEKAKLSERALAHVEGRVDPALVGAEPLCRKLADILVAAEARVTELNALRARSDLLLELLAEHKGAAPPPKPTGKPHRVKRKG